MTTPDTLDLSDDATESPGVGEQTQPRTLVGKIGESIAVALTILAGLGIGAAVALFAGIFLGWIPFSC